jgi:Tol biopolymer transport system component
MLKRHLMILLLGFLLGASVVQAQEEPVPIIAVSKGDIYAISPVDGSIKQLTHHASIAGGTSPYSQRDLALSPDGHYLVYLQTPRFFAIAIQNNLVGNFNGTPADVVLLNISTGEEKVIAQQQANITYKDRMRLWYRNDLTWSPDGTRVMFVQYRGAQGEPSFNAQVILYSLSDNTSRTLVELKTYASKLRWLSNSTIIASSGIYDLGGSLISLIPQFYLNGGMTGNYSTHYQGRDYVIVDSADVIPHDGRVYLMDMLTGAHSVVDGIQASVSDTNPDESLVFIKDDNDTRPWYVINPKSGAIYNPPRQAPYAVDFTFSPDGKQFAYILLDTSVNISDLNGHDLSVAFKADTIIWGRKRYTIAN